MAGEKKATKPVELNDKDTDKVTGGRLETYEQPTKKCLKCGKNPVPITGSFICSECQDPKFDDQPKRSLKR